MAEPLRKSNRVPVVATGILALVIMASTVYLVHYYGETRPTVAEEQSGRIHSATIHSRTVYLTSEEYALVITTHVLAVVSAGVFLGLLLRSIRFSRS